MKVILAKEPDTEYSIEAGKCDNKKHFDHHGKFAAEKCPANNNAIPYIGNSTIGITHIDADTLLGLARMCYKNFAVKGIDLDLLERIDCNGSSTPGAEGSNTLAYMVGVSEVARGIRFPRCGKKAIDVTDKIKQLLAIPVNSYIQYGKQAIAKSEHTYIHCLHLNTDNVGFWVIGKNDPLDPSRAYKDGYEVVVVYRKHYKSISIYCAGDNDYSFGNKTINNIYFAGHPKACGSPRGTDYTFEQAKEVFITLVAVVDGGADLCSKCGGVCYTTYHHCKP